MRRYYLNVWFQGQRLIMLWELQNKCTAVVSTVSVFILQKKIQTAYFPSVEVCLVTRKTLCVSVQRKADAHTGPTQRATLFPRARVPPPPNYKFMDILNTSDNRKKGWS